MALLTIGSTALPTPSSYQIGVMDITNAERNAQGLMLIERIAQKRKIEISYAYLSASDLASIMSLTAPIFYNLTYLDPATNTYVTGSFYNGDRTMGMIDFQGGVPRYKDLSIHFIER